MFLLLLFEPCPKDDMTTAENKELRYDADVFMPSFILWFPDILTLFLRHKQGNLKKTKKFFILWKHLCFLFLSYLWWFSSC